MDNRNLPFGHLDFYQQKQAYVMTITQLLRRLLQTPQLHSTDILMIERFIDNIYPIENIDLGRLPYWSSLGYCAKKDSHAECLFAIISFTIEMLWQWSEFQGKDNVAYNKHLDVLIKRLTEIVDTGLHNYRTIGDLKLGFTLIKK